MKRTVLHIFKLFTPGERKRAAVILALMFLGMALETLGIGLVLPALALMTRDDLQTQYPALLPLLQVLGDPGSQQLVANVILGLVVLYVFKNLYLAYVAWKQNSFAFDVQASLSQRVFSVYLQQPYIFHLERNSAQLIHNVTREVELFTYNGLLSTLLVATEGLVIVGIAILLMLVEPVGAVGVVIVLGGASWFFYRLTRRRLATWGAMRLEHEGLRIQHLQQALGGVKDVKLLGREEEFLSQYHRNSWRSAMVGKYQATMQQLPRLWIEVLAICGLATLVLAMQAQGRDMASMIPALGLFSAAAFRLMPSVNRVLGAVQAIRYTAPGLQVLLNEIALETPPTNQERSSEGSSRRPFADEIRLTNVAYIYPEAEKWSLTDVSVVIRKGESVGFVGPSGAGKTTLVDVILGLLKPARGQVSVDAQDIHTDLRSWQDSIGYVPQSIYLTDDTLLRNVAFGLSPDMIDDVAVRRAIRSAQLEEFVAALPNGLETIVGERGIRLSGGQRQRIGIARALYHDPAVLVLDEATSALDTSTEAAVMDAVTALKGEKTIIVVAHRLSTVEHCDRLYRLDGGRVVAEGTLTQVLGVPLAG